MKKYDVYGIGNALLDIEIKVPVSFLKEAQIKKGVMTLVNKERQAKVFNQVGSVQHKQTCGGSAANTMIAVSQFGGRAFYSCKVANDKIGDFYLTDLLEQKVANNLSKEREEGVTGTCMVFITPDADRSMETFLGMSKDFSDKELDLVALQNSKYLYIEGYLSTQKKGQQTAIKARKIAQQARVKTALTLSDPGVVQGFKKELIEILSPGVDILFCNENEALYFSNQKSLLQASQILRNYAQTVVVTQGPQGATIFDETRTIEIMASKVLCVDTNGAGDLFAGAFLYAITHDYSYSEAGKLGCEAASSLVTQFGPRLKAKQAQKIHRECLGKQPFIHQTDKNEETSFQEPLIESESLSKEG